MNDKSADLSPDTFHGKIDLKFFPSEIRMPESSRCETVIRFMILRKYVLHYQYMQHIAEKATSKFLLKACSESARSDVDFLSGVWEKAAQNLRKGDPCFIFDMLPENVWKALSPILDDSRLAFYDMHVHIVADMKEQLRMHAEQEFTPSPQCEVVLQTQICSMPILREVAGECRSEGKRMRVCVKVEMIWEIILKIQESSSSPLKSNRFLVHTGALLWRYWDEVCASGGNEAKKQFRNAQHHAGSVSSLANTLDDNIPGQTPSIDSAATVFFQSPTMMPLVSGANPATPSTSSFPDNVTWNCQRCESLDMGAFVTTDSREAMKRSVDYESLLKNAFERASLSFKALSSAANTMEQEFEFIEEPGKKLTCDSFADNAGLSTDVSSLQKKMSYREIQPRPS